MLKLLRKKKQRQVVVKVTGVGKYRIYDRLRKPLEGGLLEKDAKKFIENDGSKRYRISTHPDFVASERGNLLRHSDAGVRGFVKKLHKDVRGKRKK